MLGCEIMIYFHVLADRVTGQNNITIINFLHSMHSNSDHYLQDKFI